MPTINLFKTGIRPAIDEYLAGKAAETRDYGKYWSASTAGHCHRMQIFARLGIPASPEMAEHEANRTRIFESGHIFHEWLQRITVGAGLSLEQELELQDEDIMVRGHLDDIIYINNRLIIYDYKTAHSDSFGYKKTQPIGYYHSMQLATYMYMLRKHTNYLADEGRIMSISKDDLRLHETNLLWSDEWVAQVEAYWNQLNAVWASRKVPPCTCLQYDGGFFGKRSKKGKIYNNYFYNEQPCSMEWFKLNRKETT